MMRGRMMQVHPRLRAGWLAVALAATVVACTDSGPAKVEPLPATTTIASTQPTTPPVSLPAGCDGTSRKRTEAQYATIDGVDPTLLSLDAYVLPKECGPRPAVFWVHSGEWSEGDKRTRIKPLADLAAQRGWVLVSVNYRLSTDGSDVMWPDHGNDVAAAIAFTLENAADYRIDPDHVAVVGYEAGGHLATMVAVDPTLLSGAGASRDDIDCLAALDPEGLSITKLIDEADEDTILLVEAAFGSEFETYQLASPNVVLTQVAGQVEGEVADIFLLTRGSIDRQALAYDFADLATTAGAAVEVVVAEQYSTAQVAMAVGDPADTEVNAPLVAFLDRCLA